MLNEELRGDVRINNVTFILLQYRLNITDGMTRTMCPAAVDAALLL
jgi:hypothetical protein